MERFTIVTPVLNAQRWLPACIASVADQDGVEIEHLVVDGGSTDGTQEWLRKHAPGGHLQQHGGRYVLRWISASDRGMYDALNRGIERATGDWIGWLNADEQYLEGSLAAIAEHAARHPNIEIWFGDCIIVDPQGRCLAWRRVARPSWRSIAATHLYVQSCTLMLRRRFFDEGWRFPSKWRFVGDEAFFVQLLQCAPQIGRIQQVVSAFFLTGTNLGQTAEALAEAALLKREWPRAFRAFRYLWALNVQIRRALVGGFSPPMLLSYRLYLGVPPVAHLFDVNRPSCRWPTTVARAGADRDAGAIPA